MASKIENWPELERMFVVDGKSHREIARLAGTSNSSISSKARRDDWTGKRIAYAQAIARRGYETAAAQVAGENDIVRRESVLVARAYIHKFAEQIKNGTVRANAKDALEFMKFLADQFPTSETPTHGQVIEGSAIKVAEDNGPDFLRRIVELARTRVADPGGLGTDPVRGTEESRPN